MGDQRSQRSVRSAQLRVLDWDSDFFGISVAKIEEAVSTAQRLGEVLAEAARSGIRLAYWQASGSSISRSEVERLGGIWVDRKTTFVWDAHPGQINAPTVEAKLQSYVGSVTSELKQMAVDAGTHSRFAVDPNVPREKFRQLYGIWIERSVSREIADEVFVLEVDGRLAGFITLAEKNSAGEIGLLAVDASYRRRGYGQKLIEAAQTWTFARGCKRSCVVTQDNNKAACALYRNCGYVVDSASDYYHFWFSS